MRKNRIASKIYGLRALVRRYSFVFAKDDEKIIERKKFD